MAGHEQGGKASTGLSVLDGLLCGGIPRERTVLLAGGPGSGKSTVAMQFLQAGLEDGERGLFISTEQSFDEIYDSFTGFDFDLDHTDLAFATVHAGPGETIEGEDELVLRHLDEDEGLLSGAEMLGDQFAPPLTVDHLKQYIDHFGPRDRVVFDSVSGLATIADDVGRFRRTVLELIQFFTRELGATTLFTVEGDDGTATALRYNTHGVIELRRESINGDPHRQLAITKMRGVDHDPRTVELELRDGTLRVAPGRRSQPPALKTHAHTPIGIEGLDALCGGGLVTGGGVLIRQDGYATLSALFGAVLSTAVERGFDIVLVPTIRLRPSGLRRLLGERGHDLDRLLAEDRLFVLDLIGAWDEASANVFGAAETAAGVMSVFDDVATLVGDDRTLTLINADAMLNTLGADDARQVRYHQESRLLGPEDMLIHVNNPAVSEATAANFYVNTAEQVLETWVSDDGLQYITLDKSPCGFVGTTSLVEYVAEPPFIRVQQPPGDRENPAAEE